MNHHFLISLKIPNLDWNFSYKINAVLILMSFDYIQKIIYNQKINKFFHGGFAFTAAWFLPPTTKKKKRGDDRANQLELSKNLESISEQVAKFLINHGKSTYTKCYTPGSQSQEMKCLCKCMATLLIPEDNVCRKFKAFSFYLNNSENVQYYDKYNTWLIYIIKFIPPSELPSLLP